MFNKKALLVGGKKGETYTNHRIVATADIVNGYVDSGKAYSVDNLADETYTDVGIGIGYGTYGGCIGWQISPVDANKIVFTEVDWSKAPSNDYGYGQYDEPNTVFYGEANYSDEPPWTQIPSLGKVYFEVYAEKANGAIVSVPFESCVITMLDFSSDMDASFSVENNTLIGSINTVFLRAPGQEIPLCDVSVKTVDGVELSDTFRAMTTAYCFSGDTEVLMADGSIKLAKDIRVGDMVKVWDFDNGCYAEAPLFWVKKSEVSPMYQRIVTNTGRVLKQINNHRMFSLTNNTFEQCQSILGHKVWTVDGEETVVSAEFIQESVEYFNAVSHYHMNLICNGFLTSCRFNNLYPIKDMKFVKDDRPVRKREDFNVPDSWFYGIRLSETTKDAEEVDKYVAEHESASA